MSRISRSDSNIYPIPPNCTVSRKTGYVLANATNKYVKNGQTGTNGYSSHDKIGIGYAIDPENWKSNRLMYANSNYFVYFNKAHLPESPSKNDNISIGLFAVVKKLSEESRLSGLLEDVFGIADARMILDLASYMISDETAKFQHYSHWAKGQHLFSKGIRSDTFISSFLKKNITVSKINHFKDLWATENIGSGNVYVCYDSTNVNSQADGVYLVQKGHAKDDSSLPQVNTDYVVRQEDGLPITFMEFPGSIVDIAQATEMIAFFSRIGKDSIKNIVVTCDRGYISERNVEEFDACGLNFLLMLRRDMTCCRAVLAKYADQVKRNSNYIAEYDEFGMVVHEKIFGRRNEDLRSIVIIWNQQLETSHRNLLYSKLKSQRSELEVAIKRKNQYTKNELENKFSFFLLNTERTGTIEVRKRGRGNSGKTDIVDAYSIVDYQDNEEEINKELAYCGYRILASSKETTAKESREAYSKRDCVEKVFQALKTSMGMDVIGVACDDSIHGKSLIWFVASILHSLLFIHLQVLKERDRKHYTVPASIRSLNEITADRNLNTGKYVRRYQLDKRQKSILSAFDITEAHIDAIISKIK